MGHVLMNFHAMPVVACPARGARLDFLHGKQSFFYMATGITPPAPPRPGSTSRHVPDRDVVVRLGGRVVPGAPCGGLLPSQGHELLLRLGRTKVRPFSRIRAASWPGQGKGAWDVVVWLGGRRWFPGRPEVIAAAAGA